MAAVVLASGFLSFSLPAEVAAGPARLHPVPYGHGVRCTVICKKGLQLNVCATLGGQVVSTSLVEPLRHC